METLNNEFGPFTMGNLAAALPHTSQHWPIRPMPTSRGRIHFRMHYVESIDRFVVERHCYVEGWLPLYFHDFASTAFLELKARAERSFGYVVCAKCKKEIADPQVSSAGVLCEDCKNGGSP